MNPELLRLKAVIDFEVKTAQKQGFMPSLNKLATFYEKVGNHIAETFEFKETPVSELTARNLTKHIDDVPYLTISEVTIAKPRGCIVTLDVYGKVILNQCDLISNMEDDILNPFHKWVSEVLANPSKLETLQSLKGFNLLDTAKEREKLMEIVNLDSDLTEGKYGDLISRNRDWNVAFEHNNAIAKILKGRSFIGLEKKIKSLKEISDKLITEIETNKELRVSPTAIDKLANLMFALGANVEYYGLIISLANGYYHMLENNVDRIKYITR